MRNVMIVGISGAGKSTLARELGRRLGLRVVHLDRFFWRSGWQIRPRDEMRALLAAALREDGWVVDGNNASSFDLRVPRADTIVWLDFARARCLGRVLARVVRHAGRTRRDLADGCPERLDLDFLRYVWTFPRHGNPMLEALFSAETGRRRLVRLRSPREVRAWLAALDEVDGAHGAVDCTADPA